MGEYPPCEPPDPHPDPLPAYRERGKRSVRTGNRTFARPGVTPILKRHGLWVVVYADSELLHAAGTGPAWDDAAGGGVAAAGVVSGGERDGVSHHVDAGGLFCG